ncbi:unnamed protein product, partial [Closterium sp. NIES-65]
MFKLATSLPTPFTPLSLSHLHVPPPHDSTSSYSSPSSPPSHSRRDLSFNRLSDSITSSISTLSAIKTLY